MPQRLTKTISLVACMLLFGALCAGARDAQPKPVHSLDECIRIALESQANIIVARNNVVAARSRADRARSAYLPRISIQNNAFRWGSESVLSQVTTGAALGVDQNVFDGGLREATARNAKYGVTQNASRLTRTTQTLVFDVTRAYYDVLRAKHLAEVAESSVKYSEELRKQVIASAEAREKQIYLDIQVQVEEAYLDLTGAKDRLAASELSLAAAGKNYDVQKDKFSQGMAITLDILNAEVQVVTAQTNEVQARYDYLTAAAQLDYAVGK